MQVENDKQVNKLLGRLGFAKKAGKLITGCELTTDAVRKQANQPANRRNTGGVIMIAADASANTVKKAVNCCAYYQTACYRLPIGKEELSGAIGKMSLMSVCGVFDEGFAKAIKEILEGFADPATNTNFEERDADGTTPTAQGVDL